MKNLVERITIDFYRSLFWKIEIGQHGHTTTDKTICKRMPSDNANN